jgi:hypothetical protein
MFYSRLAARQRLKKERVSQVNQPYHFSMKRKDGIILGYPEPAKATGKGNRVAMDPRRKPVEGKRRTASSKVQ